MKSKIFSSDYMRTMSKGMLWIPAFLTLGYLLAFPVAELLSMENWFGIEYTQEQIAVLYENLWRDGFVITGAAVTLAAAVMNGISGFWYLYSSRKVDFYHCLPIRRTHMFWYKAIVGIVYYLIPYAFMEFAAVCIGAMRGFFNMKLMGMALELLAIHFIMYLFVYFSVVLMVVLTGNILTGVLALAGLFLYGPVLCEFVKGYRTAFYSTAYTAADWGLVSILGRDISPATVLYRFCREYAEGEGFLHLVRIAAEAVIFCILAYQAYVRRPSEKTGQSMIYPWIGELLKYLVVVPFGMGVGIIFYFLPVGDSKFFWWIFGMALGTVIAHGIMETLYHLDFRKFFSGRLMFVVSGITVAFFAVWFYQDLGGYDHYLPKQEKIAKMNFDLLLINRMEYETFADNGDGTYTACSKWAEPGNAFCWEDGFSSQAYAVLGEIVESQRGVRDETPSEYYGGGGISRQVFSKYTLDSGREIYRSYMMDTDQIYRLMSVLYEEAELKEKSYSWMQTGNDAVDGMQIYFADGRQRGLFIDEPEKRSEFLEALRADVEEADAQELLEQPVAVLYLDLCIPELMTASRMIPGQDSVYQRPRTKVVEVLPSFEKTIEILKETGYFISMEDVALSAVEIEYYGKDDQTSTEPITYTKPEELIELKKALVPEPLTRPWIGYSGENVCFRLEGDPNFIYASLREDQLPDFVKEMRDTVLSGGEIQESGESSEAEESSEPDGSEEENPSGEEGVPAEEE